MAALRSSLRMLSRGSSVSSAAAYMGGRGMELNQVLHRAVPPLPAVAPPVHTAAIRNFEGCRRFSTGFGESADKAESGKRMWGLWQRVKYRMDVDSNFRTRIHFVYSVFVLGTPFVLFVRGFSLQGFSQV